MQLAAMAREDPSSLASVSNFSVVRRGVGSVRWLEPTDVRALDLDTTVQLSKGSIEVRACGTEPGRGWAWGRAGQPGRDGQLDMKVVGFEA
jgi:nuclear pore complex protein Nup98-Nup96